MNSPYKKIVPIIDQEMLLVKNQGLMNGYTGLCIFYYHLAKTTKNAEYEKIADDLLDKVFSNLSSSVLADFENGLAGIGWGVEYLVQNGFAEGNTDEILEEVDNKVFCSLNEDTFKSFELTNGLTGYLFYLINRLKNPYNPPSMVQQINRELLILTINKIDELVTTQFPSMVKEINFNLFWRFPVMFYGLYEAFKLNIYNEKIRCMIKQWLPNLEAYTPSMHVNRVYMATVLSLINKIIPEKRLEKQIQILLFATDFEEVKTEVDGHTLNICLGWTGLVWLMKKASQIIPESCPNHSLIDSTANEITAGFQNALSDQLSIGQNNKTLRMGLSDGISGIGLLNLLYPDF